MERPALPAKSTQAQQPPAGAVPRTLRCPLPSAGGGCPAAQVERQLMAIRIRSYTLSSILASLAYGLCRYWLMSITYDLTGEVYEKQN